MVRAAAAAALVGAVALPMIRRRLRARGVRPEAILAGTALAPVAAAVLWPRVRSRAAIVCALQMYAYVYAYKLPNDDEEALAARVHFDYPIRADRLLGLGELPSVRLQRAFHPDGHFRASEKVLVWAHWVWFATPHASLAYLYFHDRPRFARAAVLTYAVFDTGVIAYWLAPTAPPWYAAQQGRLGGRDIRAPADGRVRRGLLAGKLGGALLGLRREPARGDAVAALRDLDDGGDAA